MEKARNTTQQGSLNIRMRRFIVEAPEPQNGQKASSGGIRENGRLKAQFKNPVPYDAASNINPASQPMDSDAVFRDQMKQIGREIAGDLVNILWQEWGRPFVRYVFVRARNAIESRAQTPVEDSKPRYSRSEKPILDEEDVIVNVVDFGGDLC